MIPFYSHISNEKIQLISITSQHPKNAALFLAFWLRLEPLRSGLAAHASGAGQACSNVTFLPSDPPTPKNPAGIGAFPAAIGW